MNSSSYARWAILSSLWLSACASVGPAATPAEKPAAEPVASAEDSDLPQVALDADTLYRLLIGEIAGQRGQIGVAAATLGRVAQETGDPRVAERATLAAVYAKRFDEALKSAELWVQLRPNSTDAREALAVVLMELKRPQDAYREFERILAAEQQTQGGLEQAYLRLVAVLGRLSDRAQALATMQQLVALHPRIPAAQLAYAHLAVRGGELDRALAAAEEALTLTPGWDEAALFKARILLSQKEPLRAQEFYESFLASYPQAVHVRLNYARHLIDQKQWDKARSQFERVVQAAPADADAVYALGLLSLQTGKPDEAEKYLREALRLRPDNDAARLYLGQVAEQQKHYDEAIRWYRDVPPGESHFEAQARLAVVMARRGDLDGARRHLHGIAAESEQQRAQLVLAEEQMLRDAKRYREAFDVLSEAIRALPDNNDLLYARALTAEKLNLMDVVEADLRKVISRDPKNAHALNALGYTLADRTDRLKEAQDYLAQAMVLRPEDAFILDSMGWLQYRLGNFTEAIRYLRRALEVRNDAEISAHLGEVLWVSGQRNEAESVWSRALKETPDSEAVLDVIKKFKP
jgi:tetratricopeptide (TPR) repeat protein